MIASTFIYFFIAAVLALSLAYFSCRSVWIFVKLARSKFGLPPWALPCFLTSIGATVGIPLYAAAFRYDVSRDTTFQAAVEGVFTAALLIYIAAFIAFVYLSKPYRHYIFDIGLPFLGVNYISASVAAMMITGRYL